MYLLDTNVISELMRSRPAQKLASRITQVPDERLHTSSITVGEVVYGAYRVPERRATLLARFEALASRLVVLSFDEMAARRYGALRFELERAGTPLQEADLRIASIALVRDLTLITASTRHFERVPELEVANWLA